MNSSSVICPDCLVHTADRHGFQELRIREVAALFHACAAWGNFQREFYCMSLSKSFNTSGRKHKTGRDVNGVFRDKHGREIKHESDFLSKRQRHEDGSYGLYRAGKLIAKEDVPDQGKFHKPTHVSTIVEHTETTHHVPKGLNVNAPSMKL
jgi:hypothetical protein